MIIIFSKQEVPYTVMYLFPLVRIEIKTIIYILIYVLTKAKVDFAFANLCQLYFQ